MEQHLSGLLSAGRLKLGDELFHKLRGGGASEVTARVCEAGIEVGGKVFASPSTAAGAVTGKSVNGWKYWRVRSTGALIDSLREPAT